MGLASSLAWPPTIIFIKNRAPPLAPPTDPPVHARLRAAGVLILLGHAKSQVGRFPGWAWEVQRKIWREGGNARGSRPLMRALPKKCLLRLDWRSVLLKVEGLTLFVLYKRAPEMVHALLIANLFTSGK